MAVFFSQRFHKSHRFTRICTDSSWQWFEKIKTIIFFSYILKSVQIREICALKKISIPLFLMRNKLRPELNGMFALSWFNRKRWFLFYRLKSVQIRKIRALKIIKYSTISNEKRTAPRIERHVWALPLHLSGKRVVKAGKGAQ